MNPQDDDRSLPSARIQLAVGLVSLTVLMILPVLLTRELFSRDLWNNANLVFGLAFIQWLTGTSWEECLQLARATLGSPTKEPERRRLRPRFRRAVGKFMIYVVVSTGYLCAAALSVAASAWPEGPEGETVALLQILTPLYPCLAILMILVPLRDRLADPWFSLPNETWQGEYQACRRESFRPRPALPYRPTVKPHRRQSR